MKSKIFVFISILILVGLLFCVESCKNNLLENQATININLDLSKIVKTSRNTSSSTEYMLKIFVYDATSFTDGVNIETLPIVAQTENKVDNNGQVKAKIDVEIGLNVIFVAKLYLDEEKNPIYAGKSEVFKVQPKDNKVHLVLTKTHEHTFSSEWSTDGTHHWRKATCEHTSEVNEKAKHTFGEYVSNNDATTDADGTKTRVCSVCGYEDTVTDEGSKIHVHTFATEWTYDGAYHWKVATCGHISEVSEKAAHLFEDEVCTVCTYTTIPTGFVLIKGGTFQMGSTVGNSDETPVHEVNLTKNFYMGKYEVTQGEYEKYCEYGESSPSANYGDGNSYPAYYVSWYDALVYCNKRSMAEGLTPCYKINNSTNPSYWGTIPTEDDDNWSAVVCDWGANGYRLPTEAEWEYAARAGDDTVDTLTYSGTSSTSSLGDYAWYVNNSNYTTHEVGTTNANAFGLYDMSGNVWEYCWNWRTSEYDTTTEGKNDPTGALSGVKRVFRGGSLDSNPVNCSVSRRSGSSPDNRHYSLGLRLVRSAE